MLYFHDFDFFIFLIGHISSYKTIPVFFIIQFIVRLSILLYFLLSIANSLFYFGSYLPIHTLIFICIHIVFGLTVLIIIYSMKCLLLFVLSYEGFILICYFNYFCCIKNYMDLMWTWVIYDSKSYLSDFLAGFMSCFCFYYSILWQVYIDLYLNLLLLSLFGSKMDLITFFSFYQKHNLILKLTIFYLNLFSNYFLYFLLTFHQFHRLTDMNLLNMV